MPLIPPDPNDMRNDDGTPFHFCPPSEDPTNPAYIPPAPKKPLPHPPADVNLRQNYEDALKLHPSDPGIPPADEDEDDTPADVPPVQPQVGQPLPPVRRKGGQPGNLNALKHGLYLDGRRIKNSTPVELAQLYDVTDLITRIKQYMAYTYDYGMRSRDLREINETMRALSLAAMSLTRLADMHRESVSTYLDKDIKVNSRTDIPSLITQYQKKLEPYLDLIKNE